MRAMGQCLYRTHQFHTIIGCFFITAIKILRPSVAKYQMSAPATSTRIAFTRAICVSNRSVCFGSQWVYGITGVKWLRCAAIF